MRGKAGSAPGKYGYQPIFNIAWTRRGFVVNPPPDEANAIRIPIAAMLAEVTGYSKSMVRQVLAGWRKPSQRFVERASEFLGLPPEALFTEEVRP